MNCLTSFMKKMIFIFLGSLLFIAGSLLFFILNPTALKFQSLESVTETGAPVFNEILWVPGLKKDIWLMRQSHHGHHLDEKQWDRLAIVVDKSRSPKVAQFYQLKSGDLSFEPTLAMPLKARCYACHANGPRSIHMNTQSEWIKTTWSKRVTAALWNLRIKTYGQVKGQAALQFQEGIVFSSQLPLLKKKLTLKSCAFCHSENALRQPLHFEHLGTMRFLVKNKIMPPFPFQISEDDEKAIDDLIKD